MGGLAMTMPDRQFRVLFVCTGNVCRSPSAEAFLGRRLEQDPAGVIAVASAGLGTDNGWPIDPTTARLLEKRGLPAMAAFRSRRLTETILDGSDLILTGTREHRMHIGGSWPHAYPRTFTLRECAWLLSTFPAELRSELPLPPAERAREVLRWLQSERGLVAIPDTEVDIADPIGRRPSVYRRMLNEVDAAVDKVAAALLP